MKKVAIITLNGYFNYGNRLQNYAVQEVLKYYGFQVETLLVNVKKNKNSSHKNSFKDKMENLNKESIRNILQRIEVKLWIKFHKNEIDISNMIRTETFKKFSYNYISETKFCVFDNDISQDLVDKYEYFVTGSDQVWNPAYMEGSPIYFLTFAPRTKRISFSPSFGVSKLPLQFKENYRNWINEMNFLSVREDEGAKIIKELTGRDAPVLVDPTLLLTKEKWLSIAKEANNKPKGKYLLTYFLGGIPGNYKKQIKNIAKANELEIINLGDIREKETYMTGPSEFIDYINSCSVFCTDSFHGAVFSILMEKPFIVYERMGTSLSMYSRINTLLNKFDLNCRKVENIKTNEDVFNIDYSHVPAILESERNKALKYLKEALNVKDEV